MAGLLTWNESDRSEAAMLVIQPGDTYWLLAKRFRTTLHQVVAANPGVDPFFLFIGQIINIPFVSSANKVHGIKTTPVSHRYPYGCLSKAEVDLKSAMRMLWEQHVEIAAFLNSINPYWSEEAMKAMLYEYLALTKSEAVFRLNNDYLSDISTYDKIEQQALAMADAFTDGMVKQFPGYFLLG